MTDVLAIAEHRQGELRDVSLELVTAGSELAEQTGGELHVAVISGAVNDHAEALNRGGVDTIHTVDHNDEFNHDVYVQAIEQLVGAVEPSFLLTPHSVNGMDYAPAVASGLDRSLATDVVGIDYDDGLSVTRELYGGKVEGTIDITRDSAVLTVRPAEWSVAEADGDATVESFDADIDDATLRTSVNGFEEVAGGDVDIGEAEFLVSIGRGIEEEENIELIEELADALGATLSASRPIVDNDWLPKNRQVGQSGKVVSPDVYIAIGISGAVQHVAGMKGADTIVAINTDPDAPIFDIADYGIVDDLFDVVPALVDEVES